MYAMLWTAVSLLSRRGISKATILVAIVCLCAPPVVEKPNPLWKFVPRGVLYGKSGQNLTVLGRVPHADLTECPVLSPFLVVSSLFVQTSASPNSAMSSSNCWD